MQLTDRRVILWSLVACTLLLSLVLTWDAWYTPATHFIAGTKPPMPEILLPDPIQPPLRPSDPVRGGAPGKAVTIVEFADFSCLYCRLMEFEIAKVMEADPEGVRLVWRDMPIPNERPDGIMAAVAGRCAMEQGKFWEMHDAMIASPKLDVATLRQLATDVRMNPSPFELCLSSPKHLTDVQSDIALAQKHNIAGAPTLFIGKEVLSGSFTADEIKAAVRRAKLLKP